ncbi:stage III sporulation protein AE [Lederbergia citrea]|uniref:Stage III sporulation protein AE n=1 Tax=Lederbergia citrea TaxID=2833581 RepID=A0A942Z2D0_9BACI|nr:stage III sporulation protein AE [Lederbergia citrea]MBS4176379.1 stage III sporulation protein AE [Lederbergia citrea]MBS4202940.1 stage III sporulation protein AE [Lederbergia citrea]MBS4222388.1 stage III sporulation protein AE [Lederbergia citrea]
MRQWLQILVVCFLSLIGTVNVHAMQQESAQEELNNDYTNRYIDDLGLDELTRYWDAIVNEYGSYLPESQRSTLLEFVKGDKSFSIKESLKGIIAFAFQELAMNAKLLGSLMLLTLFSVFLQSLHNAFEQGAVSRVAYAVIFMVLIIIALNSFRVAADYAIESIDTMSQFVFALLPLLLALIASSGGVASSAFFHPIIVFLVNISGMIIKNAVLPLLFLSMLLSITSTLSGQFKVSQLSGLLKKASIGILGAFITILLGVISVQGVASAVADGVAIKTAKFVTGNFIPVVGRMFTDAADTVLTASMLLKNTVGIAGAGIVLMIAAFPAMKILVISLIYKLAAALLQPLGDGPVIECLDAVSKSMMYVFASLAIVSFMFFISITIIITSGNITMMIR